MHLDNKVVEYLQESLVTCTNLVDRIVADIAVVDKVETAQSNLHSHKQLVGINTLVNAHLNLPIFLATGIRNFQPE